MAERTQLFTVTDEQGTKIRALEGTFEVDYKYAGEATAERVLEGQVQRGAGVSQTVTEFPTADPAKQLEFSEIKVNPTGPQGWNAYSAKSRVDLQRIPVKGEEVKLPTVRKTPVSKQELKDVLDTVRNTKEAALKAKYPPKDKNK